MKQIAQYIERSLDPVHTLFHVGVYVEFILHSSQ